MTGPRNGRRFSLHGHVRDDEFYWLRERDNPAVIDWLDRENARADAVLAADRALKDSLLEEMRARIQPETDSVPYRHGPYEYFYRYAPDADYPQYIRQPIGDGAEELLLDAEALASGHEYFALDAFVVSPEHQRAAVAIDTLGDGVYSIQVVDLASGEFLPTLVEQATDNLAWATENVLLYTRQDARTRRDCEVRCIDLVTGVDSLVFEEPDDGYWTGVTRSRSGNFLWIQNEATLSTDVYCIATADPALSPRLIRRRETDHEYYVSDGGDRFFILTNLGAENFRIVECPLDDTSESAWREVIAHRDNVLLHGVDVFERYLALSVSEDGLDHIEIVDRQTCERYRVDIDCAVYTACPFDNYEYGALTLRFGVESPVMPERIYDLDLATGEQTLVRTEPVPGGFDASQYASERRLVGARDGESVPVSLAWRKDRDRSMDSPLLIEAYGAYGMSSEPLFDTDLLSLLDRGFVYAIAHVRGGAERGRAWYHAGRRARKMNSFLDFIDVTKALHGEGLSSPRHTYATGASAGGLLVAAVANFAPGLYNGMCAHVPFTDVVTTMLDTDIPLTTGEYDEWGDPRIRADYFTMLGYSPYDNVREQSYPHLLVTASFHDSQVQYWEAAKWVARLRSRKRDHNLLLLRTDLGAGHSGKTGRFQSLEDTALEFAFFLMVEPQD